MDACTAAKYPGMTETERIMAVAYAIMDDDGTKVCEHCGEDCTEDYIEFEDNRYLCRDCYNE